VEIAKQLATLWGWLGEKRARNLEEADVKFRSLFNSPSISKIYTYGRIRNYGNVNSVLDLSAVGQGEAHIQHVVEGN